MQEVLVCKAVSYVWLTILQKLLGNVLQKEKKKEAAKQDEKKETEEKGTKKNKENKKEDKDNNNKEKEAGKRMQSKHKHSTKCHLIIKKKNNTTINSMNISVWSELMYLLNTVCIDCI